MPIILGVIAALFFSTTFILNQLTAEGGGPWQYTSSLRYMVGCVILLGVMLCIKIPLKPIFQKIKQKPMAWFIWSNVCFVVFYASLSFAASFSPGWIVAGVWQLTIVTGSLLTLFIKDFQHDEHKLTARDFFWFSIILIGVILIEIPNASAVSTEVLLLGIVPIIIAAFAYPLGNRKILKINHEGNELTSVQRVFGMIICSLPVWLVIFGYAMAVYGPPSQAQVINSSMVAILSGVIGTLLLFKGTQMVHHYPKKIGAVEATQSLELVFSLILSLLFLGIELPDNISIAGVVLVCVGMIGKSILVDKKVNNIYSSVSGNEP
ncbi:hypothetical protein CYG68_20525 [Morganella morganii]|uniref:Multidrug resistance efflux transporter family protein n=1 Tax=Morganella morganii TaxID=582 RepID=A0A8I0U8U6_MORMO|nr:multidrug resistance efflux transporter family protein [Morganella morganii]MBE8614726.1 hypothetical protein [Morganella morganii]